MATYRIKAMLQTVPERGNVSSAADLMGGGHHVTVKAHLDAAKNEIQVSSVKMAKDEMKDTMKKDEMQH